MTNRANTSGANPINRPTKLWNLTWDQYLSLDGAVWKGILVALTSIFVMSLLNWNDMREWNFVLTILGYLGIWWFGVRPTNVKYSAIGSGILAALFDRDKSQGIGAGPYYLFKVVQKVSYTFLLIGFSLFTWDFSGSLGAFWVTLVGLVILTQTGDTGMWRTRLIQGYVILCIIAILWTTLGVYSGRSFDPKTGQALYMVDPTTGRIDNAGRSPADCGIPDTNVNIKDMPLSTCFSAETGQRLRPMTKEEALKRNPAGIADRAITGIGNLSVPDISLGGSGGATAGSDCPKSTPCVAYDGYVLNLAADTPLVINQAKAFWQTGMDVKICDPKIRATMHDSQLFNLGQPDNSNIVTIMPVASGFTKNDGKPIELRIYPRGQGDERIKRDCGVYTPPIKLTSQ